MSTPSTLQAFLEVNGYRLILHDMGRRVVQLSRDSFLQFEHTSEAYPLPLQRHAWFGLTLLRSSAQHSEPLIWFIHFPLDEQGKLVLAARDDFMHRLLETAEIHLNTDTHRDSSQIALQDNPYVFRPTPERMANFHAKLTLLLDQPASRFYAHAQDYYSGRLGWEQWPFLGYQGIADIAARLDMDDNRQRLSAAIAQLPTTPLTALCHCLENESIDSALSQALICKADETLSRVDPDPQILTACIRGLALAPAGGDKHYIFRKLLTHGIARHSDILAAISGRVWEILLEGQIRDHYLDRLAENDQGQELFDQLLSDLLYLPDTRRTILESLRREERTPQLDKAVGNFFNQLKSH
ncbi:MAG: DUF3549 family protein [Gammaproteobacteria bacterium]|nr:DUF3549 family protein [Gammaproteobacteria bacterium]